MPTPATGAGQGNKNPSPETRFKKGNKNSVKGGSVIGRIGFGKYVREELCKGLEHGNVAVQRLIEILKSKESRDNDVIRCAEVLLSYGYGKPTQPVELNVDEWDDKKLFEAAKIAMQHVGTTEDVAVH